MIDLIGYTLYEAKEVLKAKGYNNITVRKTTSPRNRSKEIDERLARVVCIEILNKNTINILVCI